MTFPQFPVSVALVKLASVLFLIFVFAPLGSSREQTSTAPVACPIEFPATETWAQALSNTARSFVKSFWYVFRVAFPLMILAALLGALVIELLPAQLLFAPVTIGGILLVALVSAFRSGPMAFDVAIAYIAMTKGRPAPYVVTILCALGIISVFRSPWSANPFPGKLQRLRIRRLCSWASWPESLPAPSLEPGPAVDGKLLPMESAACTIGL